MTNRELAQFLLINAEASKQRGMDLKLAFMYFLFKYADLYKKDHYNHYAFDFLEYTLAACFSSEQETEENDGVGHQDTIKMGSALIHFINQGFFESDDLGEILLRIDQIAMSEAQQFLKVNTDHKTVENAYTIIKYLLDRISSFDIAHVFYKKLKHYVLAIGTKLLNDFSVKNDIKDRNILKFKSLLKTLGSKDDFSDVGKKWEKELGKILSIDLKNAQAINIESVFSKPYNYSLLLSLFVSNINFSTFDFNHFFKHITLKTEQCINGFSAIEFREIGNEFCRLVLMGNFLLYKANAFELFNDTYLETLTVNLRPDNYHGRKE